MGELLVEFCKRFGTNALFVVLMLGVGVYITHTLTRIVDRIDADAQILDRDMNDLKVTVEKLSENMSDLNGHMAFFSGVLRSHGVTIHPRTPEYAPQFEPRAQQQPLP